MRIVLSSSLLVALGLLAACNGSPAAGSAANTVTPVAPRPPSAASAPSAEPAATATAAVVPEDIPRISVADAHAKVSAGKALLVCAYGDRSKCASLGVKSGMTWVDFAEKLPELDEDQEIILYCA